MYVALGSMHVSLDDVFCIALLLNLVDGWIGLDCVFRLAAAAHDLLGRLVLFRVMGTKDGPLTSSSVASD